MAFLPSSGHSTSKDNTSPFAMKLPFSFGPQPMTASQAAFFVLCLFCFEVSSVSTWRSRQNIALTKAASFRTAAPAVLASAPKSLALSLAVEKPGFPIEELTHTKAWAQMQERLSGYSKRLELMQEQDRKQQAYLNWRSLVIALLYLLAAISMARAAVRKRREDISLPSVATSP